MDHEATTPEFRERYLRVIRETAVPYLWKPQRGTIKIVPNVLGECRRPSARRSWRFTKAGVESGQVLELPAAIESTNPTGLNHPAQGCEERAILGCRPNKFIYPKGLHQSHTNRSSNSNFIPFQKFPVFILKRNLAVMFLLPCDVFTHGFDL